MARRTNDASSILNVPVDNTDIGNGKVLAYNAVSGHLEYETVSGVGGIEGTTILSTGETGGTKFLREDGDGTSSWQAIPTSGNVSKVGTPANNQVGVWTGDGTIEGDTALTFDTATDALYVAGSIELGHASENTLTASGGVLSVEGVAVSMAGHSHEGTAILSTGETGGTKFLREDGDGTSSWQALPASGNVSKVGTPVDNQIGVWTGDGTIEGDTALTFDTATDTLFVTTATFDQDGIAIKNTDASNRGGGIRFENELGVESLSIAYNNNFDWGQIVSTSDLKLYHASGSSVQIGGSTYNGVLSSMGAYDLILQTGNATTGNITITDGASGAITLAPNGNGDVIVKSSADGSTLEVQDSANTNRVQINAFPTYAEVYVGDDSSVSYVDTYAQDGSTYINLVDTSAGASGPFIDLYHNSASPAGNDIVGRVDFYGEDSAGNKQQYAGIKGIITSPTSTSEVGQITLGITTAGTLADRLTFYADSVVPVTNDAYALGSATNQFSDLFLAEGGVINWDNGDATLTQTGNTVALAGANLTVGGLSVTRRSLSIQVTDGTTDVTTGDGKAYITIPEALNGMNLVRAQATVVTAGTTNATTVQIHNKTDAQDMLSGNISIASGGTVGTVGTINTTYDDVATNDILRIDVDAVSTTAPKGLMVVLEFDLP